jgi:hypothetical protein
MKGLTRAGHRLEAALQTRAAGLVLLALVAAWYVWVYVHHPLNPGATLPGDRVGWWSWSDQYKYAVAAQELAAGNLTPENFRYPIGYPALGALFACWLPAHPFFVPNLVLVLAAAACWWRLARRWLPATVAAAVGAVFLAYHRELIELTLVVPWNTIATQAALLAGLWAMMATAGVRSAVWLASLAAATWFVRPIDALAFAPMLVWTVLRLPTWNSRAKAALAGLGILAAGMVAAGAINHAVFGMWRSPYEQAAFNMVGFFDYPMAQKLYWTFADARPFFGETDAALLGRYPWLLLAIPGTVFWVRREGWTGVAGATALALSWLLYLGYNDFFPSSFFRFSLIHYVSWSFLPLLAAAAGACWSGWRDGVVRIAAGAAIGLVVVLGGLRLEERTISAAVARGEVTVLPAGRPLWVRFPGAPLDQVQTLRLDGRAMTEAADYQIPYTPSDLKLLLGDRARGARLIAPSVTVVPEVGEYRWAWRWGQER